MSPLRKLQHFPTLESTVGSEQIVGKQEVEGRRRAKRSNFQFARKSGVTPAASQAESYCSDGAQ